MKSMVQYKVSETQIATFLDEWDIDGEDVVCDWQSLSSKDVGKLIAFDDGSKQYARILLVSRLYITTEAGKFRIRDIVHCAIPKNRYCGYSGVRDGDESFAVRPASDNEKAKAVRIINGWKPKEVSKRVKMITIEELSSKAKEKGWDAEKVMDRLSDWANGNSMHAFKALGAICKTLSIDLEKPMEEKVDQASLPLSHRHGLGMSIQERKRISTVITQAEIVEDDYSRVLNKVAN
jgi:hypothetical protein